jgi:hypothetical protein
MISLDCLGTAAAGSIIPYCLNLYEERGRGVSNKLSFVVPAAVKKIVEREQERLLGEEMRRLGIYLSNRILLAEYWFVSVYCVVLEKGLI